MVTGYHKPGPLAEFHRAPRWGSASHEGCSPTAIVALGRTTGTRVCEKGVEQIDGIVENEGVLRANCDRRRSQGISGKSLLTGGSVQNTMTTQKYLERRTFLASSAATAIGAATGCGDDSPNPTGSDAGAADASTSAGTDGGASESSSEGFTSSSTSNASTATEQTDAGSVSSNATSSASASVSSVESTTDASAAETSMGGTSGMDGGWDGGGTDAGSNAPSCSAETDNGDHSHPLTVPASDILRGYQDAPYLLEDGGTGHTHTLTLTAYDFAFLQAGLTAEPSSTLDDGHYHQCIITCALGEQ